MAIQHRRGSYTDFDPQKMKPAEIAVVQSNDPLASDGKAVYVAFQAGNVKRLATTTDIQDAVANASTEIAQEIRDSVAEDVQRAESAASSVSASATQIETNRQNIATNTNDISDLKDDLSDVNSNIKSLERNRVYMYNSTNAETVNMAYPFKGGHSYKLSPAMTSWSWKTPASGQTLFEILSINSEQPDSSLYKKTISDGSIDQTIYIDVPNDSKRVLVTFRAVKGTHFDIDVVDLTLNETKGFVENLTRKILVIKNDRDQHTDNNDIYLKPGHTYIAVPSATSWEYTTPTSGPTLFAIAAYRRDVSTNGTFETILYRKTNTEGSIDSEIRFTVPSETDYVKVTVREKYGASLSVTFYDLGESNYLDTYLPLANISVSDLNIFKRGEYVWYEGTKGSAKTPIVNVRSIYDGGPAFSDISPVIYENGEPIIKDNKMYYAKTSYWQLGGTGCAIYEYDIGTGELHLSGMVGGYEIVNGSETMYSIVATHIMYNRNTGEWQYTSTGAGDDSHTLHYSHSYNSPLHGCTILEFRKLTYANAQDGDEDGFVFYSDELQKWVLVYCKLVNSVYRVCLQTSDYCDDGFTQYSVNNNVTGTGVNICKVNNARYVLSGDTAENNVNRFAVLSFPDLTFVCYLNLNYNNGGFRTWNTLIPVPDGEFTSYYLLTFDRAIQSPAWNWSYGNVYMYRAKERNNGLEYPLYVNGQEIAHPIQGGTDIDNLHLQLLWAKPFVSNEEIVLSEINLDNNVRRSNANLYQAVGDALEQINTGLVLTDSGEAKIYGGQHQPGAVYILPTKNIGKDDYRYIQICDYNGTVYLQVSVKGNREVYIKGYNYSETLAGSLSVDDGELLIYTGGGRVNIYSRHSH